MTQDRKRTDEESAALEVIGFKPGDTINNLKPHYNPKTSQWCNGKVGAVLDIDGEGAVAYAECGTCHDILREEL